MEPIEERELTIRFNADISSGMRWQFIPQQKEIKVYNNVVAYL
jgi:cytochrome c oxidase assembly protein Cox11